MQTETERERERETVSRHATPRRMARCSTCSLSETSWLPAPHLHLDDGRLRGKFEILDTLCLIRPDCSIINIIM